MVQICHWIKMPFWRIMMRNFATNCFPNLYIYIFIYEPRTFERLHEVHFLCRLREQSHRKIKFFPDKEINFQWSHFNFITANGILRSSQVIKTSRGRGCAFNQRQAFSIEVMGRPAIRILKPNTEAFQGIMALLQSGMCIEKEIDQIKGPFWYFCISKTGRESKHWLCEQENDEGAPMCFVSPTVLSLDILS